MSTELTWEEVEDAAEMVLPVWVLGAEMEWVRECWGHFRAAGLTGAATTIEKTESFLRLLCLTQVYHDFCGLAWDEDPDQPMDVIAEGLEIDPVALDILAAKAGFNGDDLSSAQDFHSAALQAASDAQRPIIHACLLKALGGAPKLYERMWHTRGMQATDEDEWAVSSTNANAFEFIKNQFHNG